VSFRVQPSKQAEQVIGHADAHVEAFGPTRAKIDQGDLTSVVPTQTTTMNSTLLPVRYRNREVDLSLDDSSSPGAASLAGYYYFVLTVAKSEYGAFQLPVQISVAVEGERTGAPHYLVRREHEQSRPARHRSACKKNSCDSTSVGAVEHNAEGGDTGAFVPVALGAGLGSVAIAGIVVLAVVLRGRRRRRAEWPSAPWQPGQHNPRAPGQYPPPDQQRRTR
jgi:hypothetical protein